MTITELFHIIHKYYRLIAAATFCGFLFSILISCLQPEIYKASAIVMLKEKNGIEGQAFMLHPLIQKNSDINNQTVILKSRSLMQQVIQSLESSSLKDSISLLRHPLKRYRFFPYKLKPRPYQQTSKIQDFQKNVCTVNPVMHTDLIELQVHALHPRNAAFIANTWLACYQKLNLESTRKEVKEIKLFLKQQAAQTEQALYQSEDRLKTFKQKQRVAALSEETRHLIEQIAAFEVKHEEARIDLKAIQMRLNHIKNKLDENQQFLFKNSLSSPVIASLQHEMGRLMAEKAAYEQQLISTGLFSEQDTKLNNLSSRLAGIQNKLKEETKNIIQAGITSIDPLNFSETMMNDMVIYEAERISLQVKANALSDIVGKLNQRLEALPEKSMQLARLKRETRVNNNLFLMLRQKFEENRILEAGQIGFVRIVDEAFENNVPIWPKKKLNALLGLLFGFFTGFGLAILLHAKDQSISNEQDIESIGTLIGTLPWSKEVLASDTLNPAFQKSILFESCRFIRTTLLSEGPGKIVLITSPSIGEGKSTTLTNLAIAFGLWGYRVLIMDADLRKPVQHTRLNIPESPGLSALLTAHGSADTITLQTPWANVSLLPAGKPPECPVELLGSAIMDRLLKQVESQFDLILIDTPPLLTMTDAMLLLQKTDSCLLVVKAGCTSREAIQRSMNIMKRMSPHALGIVLNGVRLSKKEDYLTYYHPE